MPASEEQDSRGIDGFVEFADGHRLVVQVVAVPAESSYAARVAQGDSRIVLTAREAAAWIREAIKHKESIAAADRRSMILALDIRHSGLLTDPDVFGTLRKDYGDFAHLGFAAVWLVASTAARCTRLV